MSNSPDNPNQEAMNKTRETPHTDEAEKRIDGFGRSGISISVIILLLLVGAATILFGVTGLRTALGIILLFFIPFYLLLGVLELESDERVFFSFFLGIGLFPVLVWFLNRIIPSFRVSIIIIFVLLLAAGFFAEKARKEGKAI